MLLKEPIIWHRIIKINTVRTEIIFLAETVGMMINHPVDENRQRVSFDLTNVAKK